MKPENREKAIQLRHWLHKYPELPLQETQTKEKLMSFIRENTKLYVEDRGSWFFAYYKCGKEGAPVIGFRADMDALPISEENALPYCSVHPGVSHRCGHDGHSAALAGFALELNEKGADKDIFLIFQPAEEIGAGGERCSRLIKEKGIQAMYAYHNMSGYPLKGIVARRGVTQCASKGLAISYKGKPAHASQPEDGINPSAAVAKTVLKIQEMQKNSSYAGLVLATIVYANAGSMNFGIAAYEGTVAVTLRAFYEDDMKDLERRIREYAQMLAKEEGLEVSFAVSDEFPETVNDENCVTVVEAAAQAIGSPICPMEEALRASEDFGYYQKQCPGVIFYIGNGEDYAPLHTRGYDFNDEILETAVDMFLAITERG